MRKTPERKAIWWDFSYAVRLMHSSHCTQYSLRKCMDLFLSIWFPWYCHTGGQVLSLKICLVHSWRWHEHIVYINSRNCCRMCSCYYATWSQASALDLQLYHGNRMLRKGSIAESGLQCDCLLFSLQVCLTSTEKCFDIWNHLVIYNKFTSIAK